MLHGFNSATGQEVLGYIPGNLYSSAVGGGMHFLTDPVYSHRYFVDLSPTVSDVYTKASPAGSAAWRTVLVGGERAGGRGLFALDVTDPGAFAEVNAANLVLWEFNSAIDPDLGSTFSNPTIALLNNGRWAAIFGNGYNDNPGGSGEAQLFILFLDGGLNGTWTLGTDYVKITTGVGTAASRNGLSTPAVVDTDGDGVADRVYAGDLNGNMWAFDLSNASAANWGVAYKQGGTPNPLFTAQANQPITSQPVVARHPTEADSGNLPNLMVMFGTGQYLDLADNTTTNTQSFYGVWDRGQKQLDSTDLEQQTFLAGFASDARVLSDNAVNYAANGNSKQYGWYIDLPTSGERMVVDPKIRGDLVYFNTMIPSTAACSAGGSGWLMSVKYANGGPPDSAAFDYNNDGNVDSGDLLSNVAPAGQSFDMGLPTSPTFLGNKQYTAGTKTTDGTTIDQREVEALMGAGTGRLSWEELQK
jgi:type IV pilus assembly protein PilY1